MRRSLPWRFSKRAKGDVDAATSTGLPRQAENIDDLVLFSCHRSPPLLGLWRQIRAGLNPVEDLWHSLRAHHWSHGVDRDDDALREAATESWRKVGLDPEEIRSSCASADLERRSSSF
ncbi:MAG: hypothetical protein JO329_08550 [Planctomycetaceae bacterium]|nr:hypothetical protein [Planctomycetaceae bacterium]MBV8264833.1 hypothetical protein [Planctomycetaceae bacterium]